MEAVQATVNKVPETRTMYVGAWETNEGVVALTGLPLENKQVVEGHLMTASRFSKGWKRIISFEVPYFKKADNED